MPGIFDWLTGLVAPAVSRANSAVDAAVDAGVAAATSAPTGGGGTTKATSTPGVAPGTPVTSGGLLGGDVRAAQLNLRNAGCDPGPIDGIWGPRTAAAMQCYIQRHGRPSAEHVFGSALVARAGGSTSGGSGGAPIPGGDSGWRAGGEGGGGALTSAASVSPGLPSFLSPTMLLIGLPIIVGVGLLGYELYKRSQRPKPKPKGKKRGKKRGKNKAKPRGRNRRR